MFVHGLNHVNVRVKDPEASFSFFEDILGMTVRRSAPGSIGGGGVLLDADGKDIIHVGSAFASYPSDTWHPFDPDKDGGPVHHVALGCAEYEAMLQRLTEHGIRHRIGTVPGLKQLFVVEPGGVMLELNFREP
jgi:catechol 2,3-dioxygenase-like lactoylglutathione lyase family enzyme